MSVCQKAKVYTPSSAYQSFCREVARFRKGCMLDILKGTISYNFSTRGQGCLMSTLVFNVSTHNMLLQPEQRRARGKEAGAAKLEM